MTRSLDELEKSAEAARAALDALDTSPDPTQDASDLRRISEILAVRVVQERELAEAVTEARANGRSWVKIGLALGISRQAAQERFGNRSA
ncbi:MAG: hypothetical protein KDC39_09895 [Actinobacteria bacterium]|nr:hypothetical protein [Actinomycetota bacterium]